MDFYFLNRIKKKLYKIKYLCDNCNDIIGYNKSMCGYPSTIIALVVLASISIVYS